MSQNSLPSEQKPQYCSEFEVGSLVQRPTSFLSVQPCASWNLVRNLKISRLMKYPWTSFTIYLSQSIWWWGHITFEIKRIQFRKTPFHLYNIFFWEFCIFSTCRVPQAPWLCSLPWPTTPQPNWYYWMFKVCNKDNKPVLEEDLCFSWKIHGTCPWSSRNLEGNLYLNAEGSCTAGSPWTSDLTSWTFSSKTL